MSCVMERYILAGNELQFCATVTGTITVAVLYDKHSYSDSCSLYSQSPSPQQSTVRLPEHYPTKTRPIPTFLHHLPPAFPPSPSLHPLLSLRLPCWPC